MCPIARPWEERLPGIAYELITLAAIGGHFPRLPRCSARNRRNRHKQIVVLLLQSRRDSNLAPSACRRHG